MSYSIYLNAPPCALCNHEPDIPVCPDPTYNLTPIFDLALTSEPFPNPELSEADIVLFHKQATRPRGLRILDNIKATDSIKQLETALSRLKDPALTQCFVKLEPENKWGTLKDAIWVVDRLLELAKEYPNNTWSVK